jgi:hypothetical protein
MEYTLERETLLHEAASMVSCLSYFLARMDRTTAVKVGGNWSYGLELFLDVIRERIETAQSNMK